MYCNVNTVKFGSHPDDSSDSDETGLLVVHALSSKVNISPGLSTSGKWIIDSGATCHICNNRSSFVELYPLKTQTDVKLGDGRT